MKTSRSLTCMFAIAIASATMFTGCSTTGGSNDTNAKAKDTTVNVGANLQGKKVCFGFSGSETEFWAAAITSITSSLQKAKATVISDDSGEDPNKQLEQVRDCITQGVDGIIIIPQDGSSAVKIVAEANKAKIPIAVFNRPPANDDGAALVAVADNRSVAKQTVEAMAEQAKKLDKKVQPLIMVGDLGDPNAIARRDGFYDVINANSDLFNKPIEVTTKWDAATGLANLQAAVQANPNIDMLFTSSDFLYPQIKSVFAPLGKWQKVGVVGHIIMGGVDGDSRACSWLKDGYIDATGVQDLFRETKDSLQALAKAISNKDAAPRQKLIDPGFVLTPGNLATKEKSDWGCVIAPPAGS